MNTPSTQAEKPDRNALRAQVLKSRKLLSELVEFRGATVEVRQPTLGQILDTRDAESSKAGSVSIIIERVFVPGTEEHLFEEGDRETLYAMPFDDDLIKLNSTISKLAGIDIVEAEEELKKTTIASPSSP